jgi:hypothetical protein
MVHQLETKIDYATALDDASLANPIRWLLAGPCARGLDVRVWG